MDSEYYLHWKLSEGTVSEADAVARLRSLATQVDEQSGEAVEFARVHNLTGVETAAMSFIVGVASQVTASAVYDALSDDPVTVTVDVKGDVELESDGVDVSLEVPRDEE